MSHIFFFLDHFLVNSLSFTYWAAETNKFYISTLVQATSCEVDRAH